MAHTKSQYVQRQGKSGLVIVLLHVVPVRGAKPGSLVLVSEYAGYISERKQLIGSVAHRSFPTSAGSQWTDHSHRSLDSQSRYYHQQISGKPRLDRS